MDKTMSEMTNRELFCVLTGTEGVMAQLQLQNVIRLYIKHTKLHDEERDADLQTMVREYLAGVYDDVAEESDP